MKQDPWTQQLYEQLAEHETAAPEGLWEDVEAALAHQSGTAATQSGQARQPKPTRSRFVALRRWAVAAAVAALMLGGASLWFGQSAGVDEMTAFEEAEEAFFQNEYLANASTAATVSDGSPVETAAASTAASPRDASPVETASSAETALASTADTVSDGLPVETAVSAETALASTANSALDATPAETADASAAAIVRNASSAKTALASSSAVSVLDGLPVERKSKPQPALALYAMNGLDSQHSSNGVQMAAPLAQQYMNTYANSNGAAARSDEPIYLVGYEEHQHHQRPITYGLTLNYPFSERLSLNTGVVYTKLQSDFTQTIRSQQIQQSQTLRYLGIPLGLNYKLWTYNGFRTYLSAGARADWNVGTHLETEGVSQHLPKDRLQWSLNAGLGLQYDIVPHLGLYAEPSLNWYPDNGSAIQNYFKDKPLNLGLQIGLRLQ